MARIVALADGVAELVHDGDCVAMEGFTHLIPFAAGHEIIRQGRRDLTLVRLTPDLLFDQMIGMGCASKLVFSWGGNPGVGSLHRFRDAVERQWPTALALDEHSHAGLTNRYVAGASGLPFAVLRGYAGTDLGTASKTVASLQCPFTGETLAAVPAPALATPLNPARGASAEERRVLVTVEQIVDTLDPRPGSIVLPTWVITAVSEVRGGSWPSYSQGYSDRDNRFYEEWDDLSRDRESFRTWMVEHVLQVTVAG